MIQFYKYPSRFAHAIDRIDGQVSVLRVMAAETSEDLPKIRAHVFERINEGDCEGAAVYLHQLGCLLSAFEPEGVAIHVHEMVNVARAGEISKLRSMYELHRSDIDELAGQIVEMAISSPR